MVNAVVLDFGGVIIRTRDHTGRRALEKKYNLPEDSVHSLVFESAVSQSASVGQVDSSKIWDFVADELSLSEDELVLFKEKFWAGDYIDHALIDFLKSCRPAYKTAILSNAWNNLKTMLAENYGISEGETVDHILVSAELGIAKPDPKIYQILADTLDCNFENILFVDDFIENIEAANSLGIQTIHYTPGLDLINEIKSRLA
ncbi:MAG: HAD family phosphatase [Chloroflexota bacterium]|nr:HAD family phosphatase [Chloroflexota bacterium]